MILERKVLIIEDDRAIAELERDYLEASDFSVDIADDGVSGLEAAFNVDYSLVLIDLMLPGMDGFEICRKLRSVKDIPILIVSARKDDVDKIRAFGLGSDDYVVKPFSPSELVARVKAHILRYESLVSSESHNNEVLKVGDILIDHGARRVTVDGKEVGLTNKEFDLLYFLASKPNIVFTKEELFSKIWGYDSMGETSTITVHINRIRDKIGDVNGDPKYIETVWGTGYRFNIPQS